MEMEIEDAIRYNSWTTYRSQLFIFKVYVGVNFFPIDSHEPEDLSEFYNEIDFEEFDTNPYLVDKPAHIYNIIVVGNKMILLQNFNHDLSLLHNYLIKFKTQILIVRNRNFNKNIGGLPDSIVNLRIYSNKFNCSVDNLPPNLAYFVIKGERNPYNKFNRSVNRLPENLIELVIVSKRFNQKLDNLPQNLKTLFIGNDDSEFNQSIDNLPDSIEKLLIYSSDFFQKINRYPRSLIHLFLESVELEEGSLDNLPEGLITLRHAWTFKSKCHCSVNNLPSTLKLLHLGAGFNKPLDNLPEGIEYLILCDDESAFSNTTDNFPRSLTHVDIDIEEYYEKNPHIIENCSDVYYFKSQSEIFGYLMWGSS